MRKMIPVMVMGLFVTGCSSLFELGPKEFYNNGSKVVIAYSEPEASWECREVGKEKFNAQAKDIMGVIRLGPNTRKATDLGSEFFASKAPDHKSNYVNRTFYTKSGMSFYMTSDDDTGVYYSCPSLPSQLGENKNV